MTIGSQHNYARTERERRFLLKWLPNEVSLFRSYLQHKVAEERAITSPRGINSLEAVSIGGIDQWIQVRGQDVDNPVLLFIHGGPGIAFIPLAPSFQGPWEQYFTVVQWDQRGAGKTYASNNEDLLRSTMNVPQMERDTVDVVNHLRHRFLPQPSTLNLKQLGFDFRTPIFFFEGQHDPFCRPSLIWQYSQTIKTPQTEFVWFDKSGQFPVLRRQTEVYAGIAPASVASCS